MSDKRVDEGWKKQAQDEKKVADQQPKEAPSGGPLPKPDFAMFVTGLATQALIHLGEMAHPVTKKREKNLEEAKYTIDLLEMIEEKTKGNLTPEEKRYLDQILYDLRMRFVASAT
jgi:hypothetical protein